VSVIDLGTNAVTATIPVGSSPSDVAVSATRAYVANSGANTVSVIDLCPSV
jgi:DNA-binding beta-propeller fold protein YncE